MTTAASLLHTSQSNVSVAVMKLERELGIELLTRRRAKGVTLTPAGRAAVERARIILRGTRDLEEWSQADTSELAGEVGLGCFTSLTSFYIPPLLRALHIQAPQLALSVQEGTLDELQRLVAEGELDLALVYNQELTPRVTFREMGRVDPYVIVAPQSRFAHQGRTSLAELSTETMVTFNLPFTAERTRQLFTSAGLHLPREVLTTSVETMRAFVAADVGFAILNQRWGTNLTADGAEVIAIELTDIVEPLRLGTITRPATRSAKNRLVSDLLAAQAQRRHPGRSSVRDQQADRRAVGPIQSRD